MNRLVAAYLLLSAAALAGAHRPALSPVLAALHIGAAIVLLRHHAFPQPERRIARALAGLWPLLVMPLLYAELPLLNQALYGGHYFDGVVIGWERAAFAGEPARELAGRFPSRVLSETLHAAYLSYYALIYAPPLLVAWRHGENDLRDAVFTITLVFLAHYLFFVFFPVEGPRYRFEVPVPDAARGPLFSLAHTLLEAGSSRGAAFPSSHVGVSVAAAIVCWRHLRSLAPMVSLLAIGLALGAVYGGFHYAIDALAGAALGVSLAAAGPRLRRLLEPAGRVSA